MSRYARLAPLAARYHAVATTYSDIVEHVPLLHALACAYDHITEMGTRSGVSTTAFLAARPKKLVCYDLQKSPEVDALLALAPPTEMVFFEADTLTCTIAPTDVLFIDTKHDFSQLETELARHADAVRHVIALHDTHIYGDVGESPGEIGLWPAVIEFLQAHPAWTLAVRLPNNHGLTVLERAP